MPGLEAVAGYAIGTFQVLFVDWYRRIGAHRRQLRLLQAELRRLRMFDEACGWKDGLPPNDETLPAPPNPTELFVKVVGDTDWHITDEHIDDNSQQAYLQLVDACTVLKADIDAIKAMAKEAGQADAARKAVLRQRVAWHADHHDQHLDLVMYLIDDALRDVTRRIELAHMGPQIDRAFADLPTGRNPSPVGLDDPRIEEWRRANRAAS